MAVDWEYVVEGNRAALKRILAMMVEKARHPLLPLREKVPRRGG